MSALLMLHPGSIFGLLLQNSFLQDKSAKEGLTLSFGGMKYTLWIWGHGSVLNLLLLVGGENNSKAINFSAEAMLAHSASPGSPL